MQNSMYYTTSGLTSLPEYQGGGYLDQYGRQQYGLGKLVKKITKPVAKVLDKVVPNEVKPFLPYVAAAMPFMLGPTFSFGGLSAEVSRAIAAAGANAVSQLSQEGAAERGLNPISLGLSAAGGYLSTPGVGDSLRAGTIVGNAPITNINPELAQFGNLATQSVPVTQGMITAGAGIPTSTDLSFLQSAENLARGVTSYGADTLSKGTTAFQDIIGGTSANVGKDLITLGKAYVPGALTAAGEQAYNAALDAQKAYQRELEAMGNLAGANKQDQINYIRRAMQSAGFNEDEISSAISRSGFAGGGRVGYGLGSLVKPAMRGLKNMKNKVVDFISRMTDDIEIRTQTDYADDSGASFDIYITPKTERGKNTLDQISQMGLAEKFDDGRYFISDINLDEATMSMNERGIKASGVYEPTAKGEEFESFRTAGQGPYGADYYGYDRLKEGLRGPKRSPMDQVDYDTIPSPTDKPEGFANGGLMNLRMGGMPAEMDLRKGGFVPLGKKERADDVPARLSKNEFVFTAKAVRNAGDGDIRKGAKRMYQIMNQLEARA
jgi:hypothetical protein